MKKMLFTIIILLFAASLCMGVGVWIDADAYGTYKGVRAQAQAAELDGNMQSASTLYVQAGGIAEKYATARIAAWQYNNAGYCLIKSFLKTRDAALITTAYGYLTKALLLDAGNEVVQKNIDFCIYWVPSVATAGAANGK